MKLGRKFTLYSFFLPMLMGLLLLASGWLFIHHNIRSQTELLIARDIQSYLRDFQDIESLLSQWSIQDSVFLARKQEEVLQRLRFYQYGQSGHAFVLSTDSLLVFHDNELLLALPPASVYHRMIAGKEGVLHYRGDDCRHFCVYRTFEPWGWIMAVSVNEREVYAREYAYLLVALLLTIGFVGVIATLGWLYTRRLVQRIHAMQACTLAIREGKPYKHITQPVHRDELGELQQDIDDMAVTIERRTNERQNAVAALRESEAIYRSLIHSSQDAIYLVYGGRFLITNPRFEEFFGPQPDDAMMAHLLPQAEPDGPQQSTRRFVVNTIDGEEREMEAAYARVPHKDGHAVLGILRDITARLQLEEQLRQSQKLEAIGTLAGGIAHDFNNILSVILGYCDFGRMEAGENEALLTVMDEITHAGTRAKDLVRQILTFSRQSDREFSHIPFGSLVQEALHLLRRSIPSSIELKQEIYCQSSVFGDSTELHQIVMNLVTNAYQAITEPHGRIIVRLHDVRRQDLPPDIADQIEADECVLLRVEDSGCGIAPQHLSRIFDPYFTTRDTGKGTGLGLAIIHGIVTRSGGVIRVDSKLGEGTAFSVYLPASRNATVHTQQDEDDIPHGTGHLLVVDDEPTITMLYERAFARMGFTVQTFNDSALALDTFLAGPERYDAVITDMTMPKKTGMQLAEKMATLRPDMPILLCTGYSEHITDEDIARLGIREVVQKPVSPMEIIRLVLRHLPGSEPAREEA